MAQKKTVPRSRTTPRDDDSLARFRRMPKILRIIYARPRFFIAVAVGLGALLLLPASLRVTTRLLLGWDNVPMHRWAQAQLFRSLCLLRRTTVERKAAFYAVGVA